jgi:lysyl-tRNA synthetase class 2
MLEFYKTNASLFELIEVVQKILANLSSSIQKKVRPLNFKIYKISDLFAEIGVSLSPDSDLLSLKKQAEKLKVYTSETDDFDDIYFRIWLDKIEPYFDPNVFTIVHSYPPSQAALAKVAEDGWAQRFEIYAQGIELGNAFEELGDSVEIQRRWHLENSKRTLQGKCPHPIDLEFIKALDQMPPCSGIALGLERLFMVFYELKKMSDFQIFEAQNDVTS